MPLVGPKTRVIPLQNGIKFGGGRLPLRPRTQVFGGATFVSAYLDQPGLIVHAGGKTKTTIGGHDDPMIKTFEMRPHTRRRA